jgi:hypothetical protein
MAGKASRLSGVSTTLLIAGTGFKDELSTGVSCIMIE